MDTATGYPVLIRAFRLALTVEGLRPRTVQNYIRSAQQFAAHVGDMPPATVIAANHTWRAQHTTPP